MELTDQLLHALLVACDQSYNGAPIDGMALQPFQDTPLGQPDSFPAAMPACWDADIEGWTEYAHYDDSSNGFGAVIFRKASGIAGKYDYTVALRGTRGPNPQDWINNLGYGWDSFAAPGGQKLITDLETLNANGTINNINFTGQSLGGALAQYAAYEFEVKTQFNTANMSLSTFNGLGGVQALKDHSPELFGGSYNPAMIAGAAIQNYWITNDLVSELGGGHLGGNEHRINFLDPNNLAPDGKPWALSTSDAHRIETGFYAGFNLNPTTDFSTYSQRIIKPLLLTVPDAASVASAWANLFNSPGQIAPGPAAWVELAMGGMIGFLSHPAESTMLLAEVWKHQGVAGQNFDNAAAIASQTLLRQGGVGQNTQNNAALDSLSLLTNANAQNLAWQDNINLQALTQEQFLAVIAQNQGGVAAVITALNDALPDAANAASLEIASGVNNGPYAFNLAVMQSASTFFNNHSTQSADEIRFALVLKDAIFKAKLNVANALFTGDTAQCVADNADSWLGKIDSTTQSAGDIAQAIYADAAQWATTHSLSIGTMLANMSEWLLGSLVSDAQAAGSNSTASDALAQEITASVAGIFEAAGNAFNHFTSKYSAPSIDWLASLTDQARREIIGDFERVFKGSGFQFTGTGNGNLAASFDSGIAYAAGLGAQAAQDIAIVAGNSPNPFANNLGFDPSTAPVQTGHITQGQVQTLTAYLPFTAGTGGQKIHLQLSGSASGSLMLLDSQHNFVALGADGGFDITVAAGKQQATFSLFAEKPIAADASLSLSSTLVDANGMATHTTQMEFNLGVLANAATMPNIVPNTPDKTTRNLARVTKRARTQRGHRFAAAA